MYTWVDVCLSLSFHQAAVSSTFLFLLRSKCPPHTHPVSFHAPPLLQSESHCGRLSSSRQASVSYLTRDATEAHLVLVQCISKQVFDQKWDLEHIPLSSSRNEPKKKRFPIVPALWMRQSRLCLSHWPWRGPAGCLSDATVWNKALLFERPLWHRRQ